MKIVAVVLITIVSTFSFSQNNYFVATTGNNSNNGSLSSPWATIQHGVNQLTAGDTLNIRTGTYEEKIDIDVSGTLSAYITIRNYQNEGVILDAINFSNDLAIIWTDNAYLRIEGLHLTNNIFNNCAGLIIQDVAHHIDFINNKISNIKFSADPNAPVNTNTNAVPLNIYADNAQDSIHHINIKGNEVYNNQTGFSENIAAGGNFTNFLIEDNIVHDNTNIGIDVGGNYQISSNAALDQGRSGTIRNNIVYNCNSPYSTAAGIYIDGGKDIVVENNKCFNNGYGGEIGCEENGSTSNITFRNNIFYENEYAGMHVGGYDSTTTGIVLNSKVYNNTFFKNDVGNNFNGELILSKLENCNIENNIFYISSQNVFSYMYRTQTNLSLNYNLVYGDSGSSTIEVSGNFNITGLQNFYTGSGYGSNSVFGNPLFTDPVNADFHIPQNSPAVDIGNPAFTPGTNEVDMDGESRVYNSIVDCGADEYNLPLSINTIENTNLLVYPNPTNGIIHVDLKENYKFEAFALNGMLVLSNFIENNTIDLTELESGMYLLNLSNLKGSKSYTVRVNKQ